MGSPKCPRCLRALANCLALIELCGANHQATAGLRSALLELGESCLGTSELRASIEVVFSRLGEQSLRLGSRLSQTLRQFAHSFETLWLSRFLIVFFFLGLSSFWAVVYCVSLQITVCFFLLRVFVCSSSDFTGTASQTELELEFEGAELSLEHSSESLGH